LRPRLLYAVLGVSIGFSLAAPLAKAGTPGDPFESFNRRIYASSSGADRSVLLPLAKGYRALTPEPIGKALHNIFSNLSEPANIANDILQIRFKRAIHDTLRFTANSIAGWGGLMDVATPAGLTHHDNDFGVTLGVWGVGPGPYLYLPLLGPSTVRDGIGQGLDSFLSPMTYLRFPYRNAISYTSTIAGGLDKRIRAEGDLNALLSGAADPYATLRSVYLQNREAEIRGENAAPLLPPIDEETPAGSTPAPTPPETPSPTPPPAASQAPSPGPVSLNDLPDPDAPMRTARAIDIDPSPPATRLAAN